MATKRKPDLGRICGNCFFWDPAPNNPETGHCSGLPASPVSVGDTVEWRLSPRPAEYRRCALWEARQ